MADNCGDSIKNTRSKKGKAMENDKSEFLEIIEDISKFVGAFAGAAVVTGRKIQHCVKSMITVEPKPSDRTVKKLVKVRAKKKKTKKPKRTTRPRSHPASEQT